MCVVVCTCVCVYAGLEYGVYEYVCVYLCVWNVFISFLHVIKWGSIAQVSTRWTSQARGARSYTLCVGVHVYVETICVYMHVFVCIRCVCICAYVIALPLMQSQGYIALS